MRVVWTVAIMLLSYLLGAVWWASSISTKIDALTLQIEQAAADRWTGRDHSQYAVDVQRQLDGLKQRVDLIEQELKSH